MIKYSYIKTKTKKMKLIDNILKNIFMPKTINNYKKLWKPYGIIISKHMLKFHNNDIRRQIKKELLG